jgi:hypothetical protein
MHLGLRGFVINFGLFDINFAFANISTRGARHQIQLAINFGVIYIDFAFANILALVACHKLWHHLHLLIV